MKEKIFAITTLIVTITAVITNTIILNSQINKINNAVSSIKIDDNNSETALTKAKEIFEEYKKKETYISITVNHDDLTNINDSFVELIGYLSVKKNDEAVVTKNRLESYLEHLGRLSGFNIDAII